MLACIRSVLLPTMEIIFEDKDRLAAVLAPLIGIVLPLARYRGYSFYLSLCVRVRAHGFGSLERMRKKRRDGPWVSWRRLASTLTLAAFGGGTLWISLRMIRNFSTSLPVGFRRYSVLCTMADLNDCNCCCAEIVPYATRTVSHLINQEKAAWTELLSTQTTVTTMSLVLGPHPRALTLSGTIHRIAR